MKKRRGKGKPLPSWLLELPKGEYRLSDLAERFSVDKNSISQTLRKYGGEMVPRLGPSLRYEAYVVWNGFDEE